MVIINGRLGELLKTRLGLSATQDVEEIEDTPHQIPKRTTIKGEGHTLKIHASVAFDENAQWSIEGEENTLQVDEGVRLTRSKIIMKGKNLSVRIGRNCRFKQGTLSVSGNGSSVIVGDGTTWESGQIIASHGMGLSVGRDCMFSHDIMIRTSDGHGIFDRDTHERFNENQSVVIGNHVWIGNAARVGKGANIGQGTVLAQKALLTGNAEPHCVYGGVPARKLREDIVWSRTENYDGIPDEYR